MESKTVRCKFKCVSIAGAETGDKEIPAVYSAKLQAVTAGSKENEKFFKWTPSGILDLQVVAANHFVPGKEYYLDITEA